MQTGHVVETIRCGSIENLQMVALRKPSRAVMTKDELLHYLDDSSVVLSIATAIHINNLNKAATDGPYVGHEPDVLKKRSVAQGFHCGFITDFEKDTDPGARSERSKVYLQGIRSNQIDPDRRSPFDYKYRLDLPIRSYEGRDFRVDPNGAAVKVYCDSSNLRFTYDSHESSYLIGAGDLVSVLQDSIGDLMRAIQDKQFSPEEKRDLPGRLQSFMQLNHLSGR